LTPEDRDLDLARPKDALKRIRALSPHIGARAVVDGHPLIVWKAQLGEDGQLELLEVQPEGRRRMTYAEYLRGLR
jgi:methionyl-tRNA formyltransferase